MSPRKKKYTDEIGDDYPEFRKVPVLGILCCGLVIILLGLYLYFIHGQSVGFATRNRSANVSGPSSITGPGAIFIGVLFLIFPVYVLVKQFRKPKRPS